MKNPEFVKYLKERFQDKVCHEPNTGCWLWTGYVNKSGYGGFRVGKKLVKAHRWSYKHYRQEAMPDGYHQIHHLCGVRSCVNPEHLKALTPEEHKKAHHQAQEA